VDAALAGALDEVVIVLGHAAPEVEAAVSPNERVHFALNADFVQGQSTSLRVGLRATAPEAGAAVILLGDQPGVRPDAIQAVAAAWRGGAGPVVQAAYTGLPAHPTLFDRAVWIELENLSGDEGARSLLVRHPEWRSRVEVGGEPPADIDTREDYERLRAAFEAH
jgi:molybdenum cofactor cytidylyltransferase